MLRKTCLFFLFFSLFLNIFQFSFELKFYIKIFFFLFFFFKIFPEMKYFKAHKIKIYQDSCYIYIFFSHLYLLNKPYYNHESIMYSFHFSNKKTISFILLFIIMYKIKIYFVCVL